MDLVHDAARWHEVARAIAGNASQRASLVADTEPFLHLERLTVVDKARPGPSGDPHDFVSQGPYWWPDPASPNGLPYLRRDGEKNPEYHGLDNDKLLELDRAIPLLTLCGLVTGDAKYHRQAGKLLRCFFLDDATRMNPHLQYAQRIPGVTDGRGIGIIDTNGWPMTLDAVAQIPLSADWTADDLDRLKTWFSDYLTWLLESGHGRDEAREHNNHGTWYDAQVATYALFAGRGDVARRQVETVAPDRLRTQIAADGSQPHEMARTLSYSYCVFNLLAFLITARIGQRVKVDLWAGDAGASLRAAVGWMLPYLTGEQPWTGAQIKAMKGTANPTILEIAGLSAPEPKWRAAAEKIAPQIRDLLVHIKPLEAVAPATFQAS